ncbi:type III secretion system chaperone family protein [Nafulsella turpanensis]|uniref:hypothetical protein n=1 Tax=Nafulsella turpanensis TaxID=1265690 RepID=UPI000349C328|nr:hypothetical protein [Nafulsella turpanensis]
MVFNEFMERFATEIKGHFSAYDKNKSVIFVPITEGRFQTVLGLQRQHTGNARKEIEFSSKVCGFNNNINTEALLRANATFCHARFSVSDNIVKVEASAFFDTITEALLKEIILEVATVADEWEMKLSRQHVV